MTTPDPVSPPSLAASTRGRIFALDLSLTATGVCCQLGSTLETFVISTTAKRPLCERLFDINAAVCNALDELAIAHSTDDDDAWLSLVGVPGSFHLAVIEDYALHGPGDKGKTGMVHGVVRMMLWERGIPTLIVSPATLKKFATGKGNAGKPAMLAEAIKRLGFDGHDDNEVDARWLWELGAHVLGEPTVDLPQTHLSALDKLDVSAWPSVTEIAP